MKKVAFVVMAVTMICVLFGCGNYAKKYDKSTVIVKKNYSVVEVAVENFEDSSVKEEELEDYVKEQIQTYNDENGNKIKKKSIDTDDMSKVKLVLTYKDIESFNGFNLQECKLGDFSDMKESELNGTYTSAEGKSVKYKNLKDVDNASVFIVPEATDVVVSGDILYYNEEASVKDGVVTTTGKDKAIIIFK